MKCLDSAHRLTTLMISLAALAGCIEAHDVDDQGDDQNASDGRVVINYRGELVSAERVDGQMLIEGDILVHESDIWPAARSVDGGVGLAVEGVKRAGYEFRWPMNSAGIAVIPYEISTDFNGTQQAAILAAMDDWEDAVPTLSFVERTGQAAHLSFQLSTTRCSSSIGRKSSGQTINLTSGCTTTFSVHHEIAHALGLYHQHTRKNRSASIEVIWSNIKGCKYTAGSGGDSAPSAHCGVAACTPSPIECGCTATQVADGDCDDFNNFVTTSARSNIGSYDYDSVMHYPARAFIKSSLPDGGANWGNTLEGNTEPIGQRDHLSVGDIQAMHAMYPRATIHTVYFADTADQTLCRLSGRTEDVGTDFNVDRGTVPSGLITDDRIDTDGLSPGDYTVNACEIRSVFWEENYNYPNSSTSVDFGSYSSSVIEVYDVGATSIRVLNRGLIAVML